MQMTSIMDVNLVLSSKFEFDFYNLFLQSPGNEKHISFGKILGFEEEDIIGYLKDATFNPTKGNFVAYSHKNKAFKPYLEFCERILMFELESLPLCKQTIRNLIAILA